VAVLQLEKNSAHNVADSPSNSAAHADDAAPMHALLESLFLALFTLLSRLDGSDQPNVVKNVQESLESQLRVQFKFYRTTAVLRLALSHRNWLAAATIYELLGDPDHACQCRLRQMATKQIGGQPLEESMVLSQVAAALLQASSSPAAQARILYQGMKFCEKHSLAVESIEKEIRNRWHIFATPLALLLEENASKAFPLLLQFSPAFYLQLLRYSFQQIEAAEKANESRASIEQLLRAIATNAAKDVDSRTRIALQSFSLSNEPDSIAFSCGHVYGKKHFFERLLPQFKQRMAELPGARTPLTLRAILNDYQQRQVAQACPRCLYNSVLPPTRGALKQWDA